MKIKTKKSKLQKSTYIHLAFYNVLYQQWWVSLLLLGASGGLFFYKNNWWALVPLIAFVLYLFFWWIQFYIITTLAQNKLLFDRLEYQISSEQIVMVLSAKQGMSIPWQQVQYARQGKDYFLLFLSKAQLIYLPYKIFNGAHEIKFLDTLLKRKKFI